MSVVGIAVPKQVEPRERRVALTPAIVERLTGRGHRVAVEHDAGLGASFDDDAYRRAGATVDDREAILAGSEVVAMVAGPRPDGETGGDPDTGPSVWSLLSDRHVVVGLHDPLWRPDRAAKLATTGATALSLDLIPRTTRAQAMDVLSSMATVAGYEAVLLAGSRLPALMPLLMTAAGTVPAAKVVVLGAGVAGLQAIATARRLGAIVEGYDVRPAAMEQIASLGARPITASGDTDGPARPTEDEGGYARSQGDEEAEVQRRLLTDHVAAADIVITTAAVPGAASPVLVTEAMVTAMDPGSVIVDLAAERGGNCELTEADVEVVHRGVTILGPTDLPSRSPVTASNLYATNMAAFLGHLAPDEELTLDADDEITAATLLARGGAVVHPRLVPEPDPSPADSGDTAR